MYLKDKYINNKEVFVPIQGALTPLILKGLAIRAATAAGKTIFDKVAGKETRIIGKQYENDKN